ncbi:MAG: hypothetical protein WCN92_09525 [Eubacteriales bacterium]
MKEIIESIEEFECNCDGESGYWVRTNLQTIEMSIDNGQSCCERWGYFWSNDNVEEFIGAELLSVEIVDKSLNMKLFVANVDDEDAIFINLNTSNGILQFTIYNQHNGYYGHRVNIYSKQLTHEGTL